MKSLFLAFALFAGQAMILQDKPVVHLKPHTDIILQAFGASLLELSQAPQIVYLPAPPPKPDANGNQWTIDVKNFGPLPVTVADKGGFSTPVAVGQTIHILSNGSKYILKH
ncbi:MAG: hypothetical protein WAM85_24415 [Terracidiphilus sp.]